MAGRYDIAMGKAPIIPQDPNRAEVESTNIHDIVGAVVKKITPSNGDVLFISSDKMSASEWETLKQILGDTLRAMNVKCGLVMSDYEFNVTKDSLGSTIHITFADNIPAELQQKIKEAVLTDNRPIATTPGEVNETLSGMR